MVARHFTRFGFGLFVLGLVCLLAACAPESTELPTLVVLPTHAPSATPLINMPALINVTDSPVAAIPPTELLSVPTTEPTLPAAETSVVVLPVLPTLIPTEIQPFPTMIPSLTPSATITDTPMPGFTPTPSGDAVVTGENGANVRSGPGRQYNPPLVLLPPGETVLVVGRSSDGNWFQVITNGGQSGWISRILLDIQRDAEMIPVTWISTPAPNLPAVLVPTPFENTVVLPPDVNLPPLPLNQQYLFSVSDRTREIFYAGQIRGNRANVFAKVGDSITASQPFLMSIGAGDVELGPYLYLQDTINWFMVPPRDGQPNSFMANSMAASSAFNAAAVLSSIWADEVNCLPNESPLQCEYRLTKPSVAIIMLGSVDMQIYGVEEFRTAMEEVVSESIDQGVIPVLTTFPNGPDFFPNESEAFNAALRDIANSEQIPLIDLRGATMDMPNHGTGSDRYHLSHNGENGTSFAGDEQEWGLTMRNLLTLQALDILRRELLEP